MKKLCITCLNFYTADVQGGTYCPFCNFNENNEDNIKLNKYCLSLYQFGWVYRNRFEEDFIENNKINKKYHIDVEYSFVVECIKFLLLSVASGITYDAAKNTIKKFFEDNANEIDDGNAKKEFDKFIRYIAEYHIGKFSCEKEIISAVREEELVHAVTENMLPTIEETQINKHDKTGEISQQFVAACKQIDSDKFTADSLVRKYAQTPNPLRHKKKAKRRRGKKR